MVGPDVNISSVNTLYDLFTGNGHVQGVFFDKGRVTYVKHFIRTDKIIYEEKNGGIPNHFAVTLLLMILHKMNIMPNIMGTANTALMNVKNKLYVLFEQDIPYEIALDFSSKLIRTVKKQPVIGMKHFSAHSKIETNGKIIHTIDYNVLTNTVTYAILNERFELLNMTQLKTTYIPLIHDFLVTDGSIILCDSPILFSPDIKVPVLFHKDKPTNLIIINREDFSVKTIEMSESLYIFHYAYFTESADTIELFACIHENLDYSAIDVRGKYRKIQIDKRTGEYRIETNSEVERYNLDFPVSYFNKREQKTYQVLIHHENNMNRGFVVCERLNIKRAIVLEGKNISGEPAVIDIDGNPYLLAFVYNDEMGFILIVDLHNYRQIEIPLYENVNIGFHSAFLVREPTVPLRTLP